MNKLHYNDITEELIKQAPEGKYSPSRLRNKDGLRYAILRGHFLWVSRVQYNPQGNLLVSTSSGDGLVKVWDLKTGKCIKTLYEIGNQHVEGAVFSPDGKFLAVFSNKLNPDLYYLRVGVVKVWDVETFELRFETCINGWLTDITFSPDGTKIAIAGEYHDDPYSHYKEDDAVMIWDIRTGNKVRKLAAKYEADDRVFSEDSMKKLVLSLDINAIAYRPDGEYLAAGTNDCSVKTWNLTTGRRLKNQWVHDWQIKDVEYGHSTDRFATASDTVCVWSSETGKLIREFEFTNYADRLEFSADDSRLAVHYPNSHAVVVWDVESGTEICRYVDDRYEVFDISFCPDGKHVALAMNNNTIRIWDLPE